MCADVKCTYMIGSYNSVYKVIHISEILGCCIFAAEILILLEYGARHWVISGRRFEEA